MKSIKKKHFTWTHHVVLPPDDFWVGLRSDNIAISAPTHGQLMTYENCACVAGNACNMHSLTGKYQKAYEMV